MKKKDLLFPECENCKELGDCPHPEVATDGMGSPLTPEGCPRPMDIMRDTLKKHKTDHKLMREN